MSYNVVEITSLCEVSTNDKGPFLKRLADVDNNTHTLITPPWNENNEKFFENREIIYLNDTAQPGDFGVWDWSAVPNRKNPSTDYVKSIRRPGYKLVRVVELAQTRSDAQLIEQLTQGISWLYSYSCDTLFAYPSRQDCFRGVRCMQSDFTTTNGTLKLRDDVYSLPLYDLQDGEIHRVDEQVSFLTSLSPDVPETYIPVGNINELIRTLLLKRLTWPAFKERLGGTKAEWKSFRLMLEKITGESLYSDVAKSLHCPQEEAEELVTSFTQNALSVIDQEDIDTEILAQLVMHHEGLRAQCEKTVEVQWRDAHSEEIVAADTELNTKRKDVDEQRNKAEELLQQNQEIQRRIAEGQDTLEKLKKNISRYEALGNDTLQAVKSKIGEAQKDVAGFLAELSMYMPAAEQGSRAPVVNTTQNTWSFTPGEPYGADRKAYIEQTDSWEDTLEILRGNLHISGVGDRWLAPLSAFLYSAQINGADLLIAGPCAKSIANAMALAIMGRSAGVIDCRGERDCAAIKRANASEDLIIAVENPFHPDWLSTLPHMDAVDRRGKTLLWTHPFTEDLAIEPIGLLNYVIPVFTDLYVENEPEASSMYAGISTGDFEFFPDENSGVKKKRLVDKLGLSRLSVNRFHRVLCDAERIMNTDNADIEYMFALRPLAELTGRTDVLRDAIQEKPNISRAVSDELSKYLEKA